MKSILIIEDEPDIQELLRAYLEDAGYQTTVAGDGVAALERFGAQPFDLVLLDLMLPKIDGFGVCEMIRRQSQVPILMLTALDGEEQQLRGFRLDIDDYITKPFSLAVLRARVNARLRRAASMDPARVELDGFTFDFGRLEFTRDGTPVELSRTEQRLLRLLVENRGRILPRQLLVDRVWNGGEFVDENALSVAVRRLRAKLPGAPIRTVYGTGYSCEVEK